MKAVDVRKMVPTKTWSTFYKFCIVRNPWDRFISFYYWQNRKHPRPSVLEFINSDRVDLFFERGFNAYTDSGGVIVDKLIRYEDLQPALTELLNNIGIQNFTGLPTTKRGTGKRHEGYSEEFNEQEAELLKKLVSDELDVTKYHF